MLHTDMRDTNTTAKRLTDHEVEATLATYQPVQCDGCYKYLRGVPGEEHWIIVTPATWMKRGKAVHGTRTHRCKQRGKLVEAGTTI